MNIPTGMHFMQQRMHMKIKINKQNLLRDNNKHNKFELIQQLNDTDRDKELLKHRPKKQEDFWIKTIKTLQLHGFSAELNFLKLKC